MINEAFQLRIVYRRKISNFLQIFSFTFHRSVEDGREEKLRECKTLPRREAKKFGFVSLANSFQYIFLCYRVTRMSGIRFNFKGEAIKRDAKSRTLCTTKEKSFYGNMCKLTQYGGRGGWWRRAKPLMEI